MGKVGVIIKTATGIVAATATLVSLLKENPQLTEGVTSTIDKLKSATNSSNPKIRFDGRIKAIETCADAVEENFPDLTEPEQWRRKAAALRMRGELAWSANSGKERKKAMMSINEEVASVLHDVNARLAELTAPTSAQSAIDPSE